MWRVIAGLSLFWGALAAGALARRRGWLGERGARRLIAVMIKGLEPVIVALSFWALDCSDPRVLWLPVVGCAIACSSLPLAWLLGRRLRLAPAEMGIFLPCAFFSNLGYLGAFVAFALYGEHGFTLAQLYLLFFTPCFYTIGFGLAAHYGGRQERAQAAGQEPALFENLQRYPLSGLAAGLALNLLHVTRPAWCGPLDGVLIPSATALYLVAVGSRLRLERLQDHWRPCAAMSALKFLYLPVIGWLVGRAAGFGGDALRVTVLQAAMPVATMPLMLPLLFRVDGKLANHLWIATTALAVPLVPLLMWWLGRV